MKRKKLFGMVLATVLSLSMLLAGCGGSENNNAGTSSTDGENSSQAANSSKEIVQLKAYFPGDKPSGFDDVLKAVNEKLKADNVGVSLNINFLPWSDYGNSVSVKMSAGEEFDMYLDAPWLSMSQMIASGSIIALDDMVASRQELKTSIPDQMWEANKFGGKIMGIPLGTTQGALYGFMIRKDLREKYGMPELQTVADVEKFLYTVKEKETTVKPFVIDGRRADKLPLVFNDNLNTSAQNDLETSVPMFYYSLSDKKVVGVWDAKSLDQGYERITKLYKDGILSQNIGQEQNAQTLFNQGKYASTLYSADGVEGLKYLDALKNDGAALEVVFPYDESSKPYSTFQQWNFLTIPKASKHADLVMDVANWLSIKENHDLLEYGIEGTDWEAVGDSSYKQLSNYSFPGYVLTWRPTLVRTPDNMLPDDKKWFEKASDADSYILSPVSGFSFNAEQVKTEYAKTTPFFDSIYLPLSQGILSADKGKQMLKDKIMGAGGQKVIEEIQKQIDVVVAGK
ncbi:putative aldouronate transport system substrate-binding protein [Fontibacillus solani]|uniref:Putative aldouronate transport system substrate-binding protein n=1 Tax=Fontibacillus solani TaxID=1572857 RepID=A0A7W3XRQ4_9BACL|nr:extracellular solute-binding protein [Fontibacillus solani]MBA9085788.1 putative aldouronate transport system substrate-binding protein [Fontibacillus solani]